MSKSGIEVKEIPINQSYILQKKHAAHCPSNINPHCDYCICGLDSKEKKNNGYTELTKDRTVSKIRNEPVTHISKQTEFNKESKTRNPFYNR